MRRGLWIAAFVLLESTAWAGDKEDCIAAHEQGQVAMLQRKLRAADAHFATCMRDVCPAAIQADCRDFKATADNDLPSMVVSVSDARGQNVQKISVIVDDEALTDHAGDVTAVDPGKHVLRVLTADGVSTEQTIVIVIGEKEKHVHLTLPAPAPSPAASLATPSPGSEDAATSGSRSTHHPWPVWAIGGLGVAGVASFAVFGLWGKSGESSLDSCKPYCASSQVDPVYTKFTVADVSLAVGVVAIGVASVLWLTAPSHSNPPAIAAVVSGRDLQLRF